MTRSDPATVTEPPIPRIIPDANVFLNGITGRPDTLNRRLYQDFRRGLNRFVFSEAWLSEFERILEYHEVIALGITPSLVAKVTHDLWLLGEHVDLVPLHDWPGIGDRKDWFCLTCCSNRTPMPWSRRTAACSRRAKSLSCRCSTRASCPRWA